MWVQRLVTLFLARVENMVKRLLIQLISHCTIFSTAFLRYPFAWSITISKIAWLPRHFVANFRHILHRLTIMSSKID